jgi:hypothetical protein
MIWHRRYRRAPGTPASARPYLGEGLVDPVERSSLLKDPCAAEAVQLEHLGEVLVGADDRAVQGDPVQHPSQRSGLCAVNVLATVGSVPNST